MSRTDSPNNTSLSAAARRLNLAALCNPSPGNISQSKVEKSAQSQKQPPSVSISKFADTDDKEHSAMPSPLHAPASPSSNTQVSAPCSPVSSTSRSEADRARNVDGSRHLSLDAEDESVMIAVSALDDMRSGASSSSPPSLRNNNLSATTATSPRQSASSNNSSMSPSISPAVSSEESTSSAQFVSRMSGLPIVNTALRAYEQSKVSSRVVKYGAEMMESSVKSISKPVINRLPVNQIDEFACRQLDRFGKYGCAGAPSGSHEQTPSQETKEKVNLNNGDQRPQSRSRFIIGSQEENDNLNPDRREEEIPASSPQEVANRSRWHSLLYEAGGISAAVSGESMRRLKFCLQWLQYATDHIDAQILVLRNFIASLNEHAESGEEGRPISASHMQTLTNVKRDVVSTIRQVVDVVSKYAGGALPEPARGRVRQFILLLPQRWASSAHRQNHGPVQAHSPGSVSGKRHRRNGSSVPASAASTAPSSPLHSPRVMSLASLPGQEGTGLYRQTASARPTAGSAAQAAQRILTLATESLDMMRSVTGVFKETLDRADTWVDRLRVIGIQRQQSAEQGGDERLDHGGADVDGDVELPPLQTRTYSHRHAGSGSESISDQSTATSLSGTATATLTPYPPSPRSWSVDVISPSASSSALHGVYHGSSSGSGQVNGHGTKGGNGMAMAAKHLDALTLNSTLATPRSSTQSLPSLVGRPGFEYEWEYAARKLRSVREGREAEEESSEGAGDRDRHISEEREDGSEGEKVERDAASVLSSLRGNAMDVDTK